MHVIARFVGLDLRSLRPSAKYLIIPVTLVVAPVLLLSALLQAGLDGGGAGGFPAGSGPYMLIPAMSILAVVSAPQSLFSNDALGRLDTLYTALGIRRRHVVAGRYATCLLLLIGLTGAGLLLAPVAALAFGAGFDWAIALALGAGTVALIGIFLAAELPAFFGTGPGPVRTVAAIPPVIVLALLFGGWAIPDVRAVLLSWLSDANVAWLALAAIVVLGVLGAASTMLSTRLYARRDL